MSIPKHRARASQAIAEHLCGSGLTNGFCSPRAGKCQRQNKNCTGRDCCQNAELIVRAMESRGMSVVWDHDPANHPDPIINAAELAAIGEK